MEFLGSFLPSPHPAKVQGGLPIDHPSPPGLRVQAEVCGDKALPLLSFSLWAWVSLLLPTFPTTALSPGVPHTSLTASEEAYLVKDKAYHQAHCPSRPWGNCLPEVCHQSSLILSFTSGGGGGGRVSPLCLPGKGNINQQKLPSSCPSSAPWNAQSHSHHPCQSGRALLAPVWRAQLGVSRNSPGTKP